MLNTLQLVRKGFSVYSCKHYLLVLNLFRTVEGWVGHLGGLRLDPRVIQVFVKDLLNSLI